VVQYFYDLFARLEIGFCNVECQMLNVERNFNDERQFFMCLVLHNWTDTNDIKLCVKYYKMHFLL